jgi:hypothetical protein
VRWIRQMQHSGAMPAPLNDGRCRNCSLWDACVPSVLAEARFAYHLRRLYVPEPAEAMNGGLEEE